MATLEPLELSPVRESEPTLRVSALHAFEKLRWELEQILAAEDDILVAGLCNRCVERIQFCNRPDVWAGAGETYRIL